MAPGADHPSHGLGRHPGNTRHERRVPYAPAGSNPKGRTSSRGGSLGDTTTPKERWPPAHRYSRLEWCAATLQPRSGAPLRRLSPGQPRCLARRRLDAPRRAGAGARPAATAGPQRVGADRPSPPRRLLADHRQGTAGPVVVVGSALVVVGPVVVGSVLVVVASVVVVVVGAVVVDPRRPPGPAGLTVACPPPAVGWSPHALPTRPKDAHGLEARAGRGPRQ